MAPFDKTNSIHSPLDRTDSTIAIAASTINNTHNDNNNSSITSPKRNKKKKKKLSRSQKRKRQKQRALELQRQNDETERHGNVIDQQQQTQVEKKNLYNDKDQAKKNIHENDTKSTSSQKVGETVRKKKKDVSNIKATNEQSSVDEKSKCTKEEQNMFLSSISSSSPSSMQTNLDFLLQFVYPKCKESHAIKPYVHTKLRTRDQCQDDNEDGENGGTAKHTKDETKEKAKSMRIFDESIDDIFTSSKKKMNGRKDSIDISTYSIHETTETSVAKETRVKILKEEIRYNEDNAKENNYDGDDEVDSAIVSDSVDESSSKQSDGIQTPETMKSQTTKSESTSTSSGSTSSTSGSSDSSTSGASTSGEGTDGANDKSSESPIKQKAKDNIKKVQKESLLSQFDEEHEKNRDREESEIASPTKKIKVDNDQSTTEFIENSSVKNLKGNAMRIRSMSEDSSYDVMKSPLSGVSVEMAMKDKHGRRPRSNSTDGELNLPRRGLCDEQKVLSFHKWNMDQFRPSPPRGFHNLGNTCFLNATLQCLAHLPTFCQCVANITDGDESKSTPQGGRLSNGQMITHSLKLLFHRVHGLNGDTAPKQSPISPKAIVNRISLIDGTNRGYKFRPGRQEDAHEFLVHLLDAMNDGELKAAGINQKKSGWRDRLPIPRLDETTFVHRMFGGYLRSQVSCTKCGYNSNTYDPFLDLSLEVSSKKVNSVYTALKEYTRKETLDAANKWKCSGCNRRVCATKQLTCFRPPLSLCIQLKRFSFGGGMGGLMHHQYGYSHFAGKGMGMWRGGSKIQKAIEFPSELKLPLSDGRKCEYMLTGVVIHVGHSATSGHYTAFIRRQTKTGSQWYHMDDSYVEPVKEKTVLRQKDAYVLFYCRKEVKLNLPKPPAVYASAEEAIQINAAKARQRSKSFENEILHQEHAEQKSKKHEENGSDLQTQVERASHLNEDYKSVKVNKKQNQLSPQKSPQKSEKKQTLTLDQGSKRGTVQVILRKGKNNKTAWKPTHTKGNDEETGLLGNTKISKWDDDEDKNTSDSLFRAAALREIKREEKSRKRKMYLNSWDAALDKGRTKKVKQKQSTDFSSQQLGPRKNQFHQIQRNRMQMNRKGYTTPFKKQKKKRW